MKAKKFKI